MELDSSQSCTVKGQERMQAVIREIPITYEEKKSSEGTLNRLPREIV